MERPMMPRTALAAALTTLLLLAACSDSKVETRQADKTGPVSIDIDTGDGDSATGEGGKFEISLPGGIEAKVKLPRDMGAGGKFDIEGVGLYPGASVNSVKVDAAAARETRSATVEIGFKAPADPAAVADWYQQQFEAKDIRISRTGETLSGVADDGDAFTIALRPAGNGASTGLTTIIGRAKG
jgi:hypothetical protein